MRTPRFTGPRVAMLITVLALVAALPNGAVATERASYGACYEVALVRPRPVAVLQRDMPPGFTVAPFADPSGTLSANISVGFRCLVDGGVVVELLDLVPVVPPRELAGSGASYLLMDGATSLQRAADRYAAWCIEIARGTVVFQELGVEQVRAVSVHATAPPSDTAIRSVTAVGAESITAAGTLRVLSVSAGRVGFFDIAFTAAASGPPVGAAWSADGSSEPAIAVHITSVPGAPNDWSLEGGCAT